MVVHRAVTSMEPLDVAVLCEVNPDLVLSGGRSSRRSEAYSLLVWPILG